MPVEVRAPPTGAAQPPLLASSVVLVTRPQQQADQLVRLIAAHGGIAIRAPLLRIEALRNDTEVVALQQRMGDFERLIFTSANAVSHFPSVLLPLPAPIQLFAIGAATADALVAHRLAPCGGRIGVGDGAFRSETLLALDAFSDARVRGARVLVVTGEGGRALLSTTLRQRGAQVLSLAVYRRTPPPSAATAALLHAQRQRLWAIIITSTQSLHHLFALDNCAWIADRMFVVSSERIATSARDYGVRRIEVARQVNDEALVEALGRAVRIQGWH